MQFSNKQKWILKSGIILVGTILFVHLKSKLFVDMPGPYVEHVDKQTVDMPEPVDKQTVDMPGPCAEPTRITGVEDLLCMEPPKFLKQYKNPCWIHNGTFRCLPYFYLIGNAKCGTSDFFRRVNLHPEILPNNGYLQKETSYWSWGRLRLIQKNGTSVPTMTFKNFTDFFRGPEIRDSKSKDGYHDTVTGVGDPLDFYNRFNEENLPQNTPGAEELLWTTPHVVKHIQPDVKLLLILRDPIDRLYSHYFFDSLGTSAMSFHSHTVQTIDLLENCLKLHSIRHCLYSKPLRDKMKTLIHPSFDIVHLREWLNVFPREQIMIFRNEDFAKDMRGYLIQVFKFLNISIPSDTVLQNMTSLPHSRPTINKFKAGPMLPETKQLLKTYFQPYVSELAAFLHDDRYLFRDTNFN